MYTLIEEDLLQLVDSSEQNKTSYALKLKGGKDN
jgi:hypothetical protein